MEWELPESLLCSRKLRLTFEGDTGRLASLLVRKEIIGSFCWRRMQHEDRWIIVPSLLKHEVEHIEKAGRDFARTVEKLDVPESFLGQASFEVRLVTDFPPGFEHTQARPLHKLRWMRQRIGTMLLCIPSLLPEEVSAISQQLKEQLTRGPYAKTRPLLSDMNKIRALVQSDGGIDLSSVAINHVVIICVVDAEVAPILERLNFSVDTAATTDLMGLATVRSGQYVENLKLSVLKVADSKIFNRHYSGYSQASAVSALAARLLQPSLIISFGTAGGVPTNVAVGDTVLADGCLFLDRLRTRSKSAFDWGLWGGRCVSASHMASSLGLRTGTLASQIGYAVTPLQEEIMSKAQVVCLDMEAAPIAQILGQVGVPFLASQGRLKRRVPGRAAAHGVGIPR